MSRNPSKTLQERIATTQVKSMGVDLHAMAVISNIFRVAALFRSRTERELLNRYNLSFTGFTVLWVLWIFGRKQSYDLAEECGIAKGTLTGIVSTLEKYQLAVRRPHETDGRRKYVQLSAKGRSLMQRLFPKVNALESAFTTELSVREQKELSRMLRIILNTAESQ